MLPSLSPFFKLPFRSYAQGVALRQTHSISFEQFVSMNSEKDNLNKENNRLYQHIIEYSAALGVSKPRAQASVWHMQYLMRILPSIIVSHSLLERPLPLKLNQISFDEKQCRILLPNDGRLSPHSGTEARYNEFLFQHLAPLHQCLHQLFGVSEAVLWSNTLFRFNGLFATIKKVAGAQPILEKDHINLTTYSSLGLKPNPLLFKKVTCHDERGSYTLRAHCCLLNEVKDRHFCRDCPKHENNLRQRKPAITAY